MKGKEKKYLKALLPYIFSIGGGIVCYIVIQILFHPFFISGNSMEPTLQNGQILICSDKFDKDTLERGDIVVFTHNYKRYVKRIIALPGESIAIVNGYVYINGESLTEYIYDKITDAGILTDATITLGMDEYFCLGDNRNHSNDCRNFGPIVFTDIIYRGVNVLFGSINESKIPVQGN